MGGQRRGRRRSDTGRGSKTLALGPSPGPTPAAGATHISPHLISPAGGTTGCGSRPPRAAGSASGRRCHAHGTRRSEAPTSRTTARSRRSASRSTASAASATSLPPPCSPDGGGQSNAAEHRTRRPAPPATASVRRRCQGARRPPAHTASRPIGDHQQRSHPPRRSLPLRRTSPPGGRRPTFGARLCRGRESCRRAAGPSGGRDRSLVDRSLSNAGGRRVLLVEELGRCPGREAVARGARRGHHDRRRVHALNPPLATGGGRPGPRSTRDRPPRLGARPTALSPRRSASGRRHDGSRSGEPASRG